MRAYFLGTADGHTSPRRDHSGILLQAGETTLLLDCGAAAGRLLLRRKHRHEVPEILWLSHMHSDHIGQVGSLIQSLWLRGRQAPLHIFGPAEVMRTMKDWLERCLLFPDLIGFPIQWHPVKPGKAVVHGPFTFTAFATEHLAGLAGYFKKAYPNTCFDCYGLILDYQGRRYVYSADLAHPRELDPALKNGKVTALICELTHFPERELFQQVAQYPVQSLWLTHYPEKIVRKEAELQALAREEKFRGDVHLVQDSVAHEI
jgi:ribonuclease BN (tRNA processing enzyme)